MKFCNKIGCLLTLNVGDGAIMAKLLNIENTFKLK
jgi:hypothetical protein